METATQPYSVGELARLDTTVQHLSVSEEEPLRSVGRKSSSYAWGLALAFGVLTAPVQYYDPRMINSLSGSTSIEWEEKRRRVRAITLKQARAIALQILADAEHEIQLDWNRDARYFAALWDNEETMI